MASENETVASVADCIRHMADNLPNGVILNIAQCNFTADRIEAAHRREVAELRECLKEAIDVVCDGCRFSVWKDRKFVKCKRHKNWRCLFGTERWRKALEGANDEGK